VWVVNLVRALLPASFLKTVVAGAFVERNHSISGCCHCLTVGAQATPHVTPTHVGTPCTSDLRALHGTQFAKDPLTFGPSHGRP
jgi:hypothetical protein